MKKITDPAFLPTVFILLFLFCSSANAQIFTKVTSGAFVNDGGASRGVNFIDYDGDGDLDIYVTNGKRFGQRNFLYQNSGGVFTRITGLALVNDSLPDDGSSWADFDNDGDPDLCVVNWYDSTNTLYRNNQGTFELLTESVIFTDRGFSETCSWGDFNNDGLPDLIITNSAGTNHRNRIYRNSGNGNFTRMDSGAVFMDVNKLSRGVNWTDIDGDGDLDIFICNEEGQDNLMYKNEGGGYFVKITSAPPVTSGGYSWSSSWGDYDNDGDFDLFVTNWGNRKNSLYRNDGDFNFTPVTADTIVNENGYYSCSGWGDYDNDGDLDMFITQAYKTPNSPLLNNLYKNMLMETGTPGFEKITNDIIANDPGYSYSFAWGDWDGDGDLDIFTARTYSENENNSAFLNNGSSGNWLELKLKGSPANKSALGTRVTVKAVINGIPRTLTRSVEGQAGYCSQNTDLHFGLGNATVIDSIIVNWLSGETEYYTAVEINNILTIVEGTGIIGILENGTDIPVGFSLYQNYPNPFNPVTKIRFDVNQEAGKLTEYVKLSVYDALGRQQEVLLNRKLKPGRYEIEWNGKNFPSGIYFYELQSGKFKASGKMILVK